MRCERVIQEQTHHAEEIEQRWYKLINQRLTDNRITATVIKWGTPLTQLVEATGKAVLRNVAFQQHSTQPTQSYHHDNARRLNVQRTASFVKHTSTYQYRHSNPLSPIIISTTRVSYFLGVCAQLGTPLSSPLSISPLLASSDSLYIVSGLFTIIPSSLLLYLIKLKILV